MKKLIIIALTALTLTSCFSARLAQTQEAVIERNGWTPEVIALMDQRVGGYWIGMNKEMARYTIGLPQKINVSSGKGWYQEQWVYYQYGIYGYVIDATYLYFDKDGILTSYQN